MKKQTNHLRPAARIIMLILAAIMPLYGCSIKQTDITPVTKTGIYFDTVISISLYEYAGSSDTILNDCMELCSKYENMLSSTVEGSDIWNINNASSYPVSVNEETAKLLELAEEYCEMSDGKLDFTLGKVSALWDFSGQAQQSAPAIPDSRLISDACKSVDYRQVEISRSNDKFYVTLNNPDACLELGFIAKGYIADRLGDYLTSMNVTSAIINLGGNVKTIGCKPDGSDFRIGIQKPFGNMGEQITSTVCNNCSVVSSGIYQRFYEVNGQIYHHILDSSTGYPVENDIIGVSIKTEDSTKADALSTLCFILGVDKGLELIESLDNTEVLYITDSYELIPSSGW